MIEVAIHTHQLTSIQEHINNEALREELDLLPWVRGNTYPWEEMVKIEKFQFFNCKVKERSLKGGDLV